MADIRQQINQASLSTFVVISLGLGALYYFMFFEGDDKFTQKNRQVEQEIKKLRTDINSNKKVVKNVRKFQQEVNVVAEQFQSAITYLPSKSRIQDILSQLYAEARKSGVNITKLKPNKPKPNRFYDELFMDVALTGTYKQITYFISRVTKIPRIINIKNLALKKSGQASGESVVLQLQGTLVAFRYQEEDANKGKKKK
ncbi:MAG: type 4a pilus biogenesis protein PilO [Bdellovibrionales bacterium]